MSISHELFAAIEAGDEERIRAVVAEDPALASAQNADGVSAVVYCYYRGKPQIAPILVAAGQPLDIFEASAVGDVDRVRALLGEDSGLAQRWSPDGFTALHFAAFMSGSVPIAALLLDQGAPIDAPARNPMQVAPLHASVAARNDAVSRLLVERGANVNAHQQLGFTALHAVAQHGDADLTEFLLTHGADPTLRSDDGRTAADHAAAAGHHALARRLGG